MGGLEGRLNALTEASAQGKGRSLRQAEAAHSRPSGSAPRRSFRRLDRGRRQARRELRAHAAPQGFLLGQWRGEAAIFPVPASEAELAEAAIAQAAESGPILGSMRRKGSGSFSPTPAAPMCSFMSARSNGPAMRDLNEGQKIAYEVVADRRSGKSSADNLKPV